MSISIQEKLKNLSKKIKLKFKNLDLLQEALTHRSYLNENRSYKINHNERLEFLGDAVLELVVTEHLYNNFPNPEGDLTSWRAALVNGDMLSTIAKKMGVEEYLLMSRGEAKDTGRARIYLLANALESIIGAVYLDQGYEGAKKFIADSVIVNLKKILEEKTYMDSKSRFQEIAQEDEKTTPTYRVMKEWGPDHDRHFVVGVYLGEELVAEGEGKSKQEAQREAAKNGLEAKGWK
ncbi:MAG: ribonuclease III [Candidatus Moranbacteria bacterium RIFCSPHIGHO2_02_FULL_40_12b]|nr:MAG: ribonuclease III [Candidatus Moranbacteria bacterium RIFCSPHIGHO2_02_FULL_40_12b]OGI24321.1 MAG: ribonuclease III [Candidatus Moranbacteria bacterium RIFCSPHIGHO2_12_FULL_40_10]